MLKFNKSNASLFAARGKGGGFLSTTAFFIRLEKWATPFATGLATNPAPKPLRNAKPPYKYPSMLRLSLNACSASTPKVTVPNCVNSAPSTAFSALVYL